MVVVEIVGGGWGENGMKYLIGLDVRVFEVVAGCDGGVGFLLIEL